MVRCFPGFQWSGCSDNLSYGVAFSQTFVDEPERAKGLSAGRPLMNLHNNEAGRKARTSRLAPDGCELVCCGPGYRAGRAEVVQRCSCKFSWCCSVRCQQCKNTVTIHTCRV
ncbi:hypothetical protein XENOCAPTIV_027014 [Xenoophorus captivus]|uniref:Protein Wnt n=1 Tax=Xenoophorus captivus TaxID=1517983 RepID=A0ABV0QN71_9TELE